MGICLLSEEFLDMLNAVLSEQVGVVFIGKFESYDTESEFRKIMEEYDRREAGGE